MTFTESLARNKVNEAIKTGLESQKVQRILSEDKMPNLKERKIRTNLFPGNLIKKFIHVTVTFLNLF